MRCTKNVVLAFVLVLAVSMEGQAENLAWPAYGGDPGSTKYSPLSQIDATSVKQLQVAWQWDSADNSIARAGKARPFGYKVTPIMIDNVLYVSTSLGQVAAIDALTGEQKWVFDTGAWEQGRPTNLGFNHRGVAYFSDGKTKRVLMPTNDAHLWSIDAVTGKPDLEFGELGKVDLTLGLGREVNRRQYSVISAPTIVNGTIVVGSSISDGPRQKEMPPGHVRGFDVRDGTQKWIFHTIPQRGEFGVETWQNDSWKYTGNTNVWTMMSADPDLGYVYLPTGTPTNDWYGGHRLGDNLFAESLICVDAATGERVWHFQMVHHGLWDYDLPAAPNLVDINVDGKPVKAVAQVSKQGFVYVFNRVTGEPIWPIVETPVAASMVPGEKASPTQPIPSKPAAFEHQGISDDVLIDFSPELKKAAWEIVENFDHGPLFTPPSLKGTINMPGWGGGANWSGAAFDPETHMLYVPSTTYPMVVKLQKSNPERSNFNYRRSREVSRISGPDGLPLTKPPYARITAIDLDTGEYAWMVPNGEGKRVREKLKSMGLPDPGWVGESGSTGPLLTSTLLFIAHRGEGNPVLRAYNKANGELIHEIALPARPYGTPMTYMSDGKQHISVAVGEMDSAGVLTLALP